MRNSKLVIGILSVAAVSAGQLYAADPVGIGVSPGVRLFPSISAAVEHSDNYYFSDGTIVPEESATVFVVEPGLLMQMRGSTTQLDLGANAEVGFVDTGSEDDYLDTEVFGDLTFQPALRHQIRLGLKRQDDHDPFGSARTEGTVLANRSLDEFSNTIYNAAYRFGAPDARINVEVGYAGQDKSYQTNRAATRFLDFDRAGPNGKLIVNVSPKTALVAIASRAEVEYDNVRAGVAPRDATETAYLVGAEWNATAKTTGKVAVGRLDRDYDSPARRDSDGATWVASIDWAPTARDEVTLSTSRANEESFLDGADAIDTRTVGLNWVHRWTPRISSQLGIQDIDADFDGSTRRDDIVQGVAGLAYQLNRAWSIAGLYRLSERDSTLPIRDYETNRFTLGVTFAP